jgi:putative (di)nucleoside polyphosphate hydrolase
MARARHDQHPGNSVKTLNGMSLDLGNSSNPAPLPLRSCVGIVLINRDGLVWAGRRVPKWFADPSAYVWQMPQGGLEPGESPRQAALRELAEETSVHSVEILAEDDDWLAYELPEPLVGVALKGRYRGQRLRWFAMRFTGTDAEIDIRPGAGLKAEFDAWCWERPERIIELTIAHKQELYRTVMERFAEHMKPRVL